jgi:hypothetical protein
MCSKSVLTALHRRFHCWDIASTHCGCLHVELLNWMRRSTTQVVVCHNTGWVNWRNGKHNPLRSDTQNVPRRNSQISGAALQVTWSKKKGPVSRPYQVTPQLHVALNNWSIIITLSAYSNIGIPRFSQRVFHIESVPARLCYQQTLRSWPLATDAFLLVHHHHALPTSCRPRGRNLVGLSRVTEWAKRALHFSQSIFLRNFRPKILFLLPKFGCALSCCSHIRLPRGTPSKYRGN